MKNILLISNEVLSESVSNGRTLRNLLIDYPADHLAQMYLHGAPDTSVCKHYFRISDQDALRAFLLKKAKPASAVSKSVPPAQNPAPSVHAAVSSMPAGTTPVAVPQKKPPRIVRSYRNLVLRNIVWQSMLWWKKDFTAFLDTFQPEVVLLQAGDAPFMYRIARRIAKQYRAKLVMYNSESYVLKKRMYASSDQKWFWHFLLMTSLRSQYRKFMKKADYCIYSIQALEDAYQARYPHPGKSCTLYTTSELPPLPDHAEDIFRVLYCGNLGCGRVIPLHGFAKILQEVDPTAKLDIYGKFPTKQSQQAICANPNVEFHGFVDYSEIPEIMSRSSLLIHCENSDRLENLRYAFSTKIADSLASGRPFLVYASRRYPFVEFLSKNKCAHIACSPEELREILSRCIGDKEYLRQYCENAIKTAAAYHSKAVNCEKVREIISSL